MKPQLRKLGRKIGQWLKNATREKKPCGRCAVCHHVCELLGKDKKIARLRED